MYADFWVGVRGIQKGCERVRHTENVEEHRLYN
jgi:hypothetical protein